MGHQRQQDLTVARRGLMLVLSSPSGAGKTTLSRKLLDEDNRCNAVSVGARHVKCARAKKMAVDYDFIDRKRFPTPWSTEDELLEWAEVFDNYYGTPKKPVDKTRSPPVAMSCSTLTGRVLNSCVRELELISLACLFCPRPFSELERRLRARAQERL